MATALDSPTPAVVDAALRSVPAMLPILDFSTIKHELFPVVAAIFSKTSSLAIKIRGLQAFVILCGGSADGNDSSGTDGLDGLSGEQKRGTSSTALDKYTMQEKIVPLIKAIKTKEPAVMMEALNVLRVVGNVVDADFVAFDLLPVLWAMSLGPLLNLAQFQAFMKLIKTLSARVEEEQVRKLQELSGVDAAAAISSSSIAGGHADLMNEFSSFGNAGNSLSIDTSTIGSGNVEDDFERLVKGKSGGNSGGALMDGGWDAAPAVGSRRSPSMMDSRSMPSRAVSSSTTSTTSAPATAPAFSWSTPTPTKPAVAPAPTIQQQMKPSSGFRTVTPDLGGFAAMTPSSTQFSQALPARPMMGSMAVNTNAASSWTTMPSPSIASSTQSTIAGGIHWGAAASRTTPPASNSSNPWSSPVAASSNFSLPPPPGGGPAVATSMSGTGPLPAPVMGSMGVMSSIPSMTPTPSTAAPTSNYMPNYNRAGLGGMQMGSYTNMGMNTNMSQINGSTNNAGMMVTQPGKTGLDKYESLL